MVGAGHPESFIALHSLHTDENILDGVIESMAHMEFTGDVGRRNYDSERFLFGVNFCVEIAAIKPELIGAFFNLRRIIGFVEFFAHFCVPLSLKNFRFWALGKIKKLVPKKNL